VSQIRGVLVAPPTDGDLRVRFVELLDDSVSVHFTKIDVPIGPMWATVGPVSAVAEADARATLHAFDAALDGITVADDVGTDYRPSGGGGGRTRGPLSGQKTFRPGVPVGATELRIRASKREVTLRLEDLATPPSPEG
jgi:hypothetical protein